MTPEILILFKSSSNRRNPPDVSTSVKTWAIHRKKGKESQIIDSADLSLAYQQDVCILLWQEIGLL